MFVPRPRSLWMPYVESEVNSMSIYVKMYKTQSGNHKVWRCRWYVGGKRGSKTLGRIDELDSREAEARRKELEDSFTKGERSPIKAKGMTLKQFTDMYPDRRRKVSTNSGYVKDAPKLSESTIKLHKMVLRYLMEYFKDTKAINSFTLDDAEGWVDALEANKLVAARKDSKRAKPLTQQSIRKHLRSACAIFNYALLFKMVQSNPFSKFDKNPLDTDPNPYITLQEFRKLYNAAPTQEAKLMLALCRLGGLRREAARTLPWSGYATDSYGQRHIVGIDWEKRRIKLVGNHKGRKYPKRFREAPIRPLLYRILLKAYHNAEPGGESITRLGPNNLDRMARTITKKAGLPKISKFYQSLRSSCENDWKIKGHAEVTYCGWAGHSPKVSRKSYTAPTDLEFAAVTKVT